MSYRLPAVVAFALALFSLCSCEIINPDEDIPAYIRIDSVSLRATSIDDHGSISSNITDAWVFLNDEMVGIFELPALIPVLGQGPSRILVGPGIEVSAQSALRDNYLFYTAHQETVDLQPGEIFEMNPIVNYRDETVPNGNGGVNALYDYTIVDDFEGGTTMISSNNSDTTIIHTTESDLVFEGTGSGVINITPEMNSVQVQTGTAFQLPVQGKIVFMELDYKTDVEFTIGVFIQNTSGTNQTVDYITLRQTDGEWKKVYVALTALLAVSPDPESFIFYFRPILPADGGVTRTVLFDNLKLMIQV